MAPQHYQLGGDHPVFTVGVGILAYTFGPRHAFDVDHIAAVDSPRCDRVDDLPPLDPDAIRSLGLATDRRLSGIFVLNLQGRLRGLRRHIR